MRPKIEIELATRLIPYYCAMLDDPTLADKAIPINIAGKTIDLAIPVGGKRRSGLLECPLVPKAAQQLIEHMRSIPGFPNARLEPSGHVAWGEPIPGTGVELNEEMIITRGRLFGYSEKAIQDCVKASKRPNGIQRMTRRWFGLR